MRVVLAVATVTALGLALVSGASAAFKPLFTATGTSDSVTVSYSQNSANDSTAALTLYAPATYSTKLPTTVGAAVGTATANAAAADMRGSIVPLDGTIRVASAATPLTASAGSITVGEAARACAGTSQPDALWKLVLTGFNQEIPLAIAVRRVATGSGAGAMSLSICLPPADVPVGTSGRAPLGSKVVRLSLTLTNVFTVPAGTHLWHLLATPYAPGSAAVKPAAAVEAEAEHGLPALLTLVAKPAPGSNTASNRSQVSGRLTLGGKGISGRTVRILANGKQVGTAITNASGEYQATVATGASHATLVAKAFVPARYRSSCVQPAFAPAPCMSSIVASFSATSARVRA